MIIEGYSGNMGVRTIIVGLKNLVSYLFLAVATPHIPSTAMAIAGATVSPVVPTNKIHAANARQTIPTMNLSFLIYPRSLNLIVCVICNDLGIGKAIPVPRI